MELKEALDRLLAAATPLPVERVPVRQACGRIAAENVAAPEPVPHFPRAAMDGYICHTVDLHDASPERPAVLRITGAVRMGEAPGPGPDRGEAWTITTGGPIPRQGDRVLPVEGARLIGDRLSVERPPGSSPNIAEIGEDIRPGAGIIAAGEPIRPAAAGALAACGVAWVSVHRRPRLALIATGSELVEVSDLAETDRRMPLPGRVINSNSVTLAGQLQAAGLAADYRGIVTDQSEELREMFRALGDGYDAVISTGGVSVGRYDAVHRTWLNLGAERLVGRVELKPGGPFFAGRIGATWAIGLSGTPVACLAAFHLLVLPFLRRLEGRRYAVRPLRTVTLAAGFPRATDRTRALWAHIEEREGTLPKADLLIGRSEGSFASLLPANALVLIPPGTPALCQGTRVTALMLDRSEDRNSLMIRPPSPEPLVIGVVGESGGGKTTVVVGLLRRLSAAGVRTVAVKHAAHGFALDRADSDSARMIDAGAGVVVLAGPAETAVRIPAGLDDPDRVIGLAEESAVRAWGAPPECILLEGFDHPARPAILVGKQKPGTAVGEVIASVPAIADVGPARLNEEIERLAAHVCARLKPGARGSR